MDNQYRLLDARTTDYRSTTNAVSASPSVNYPQNVNASLTLASAYELNFSAATSPILTFWHKYSIASHCCGWTYDTVMLNTPRITE